ncbi:MAG: pyruvate flavodoxin/ferredoxin oxidoreductase [Planctomycetes bacterium]|nr:pyruvate flavodoxin/ferredoxin oxidoreductase [Planctomycetota bacterium]
MIEFLDGNEAVVRGAVAAGCGFFAGYPITPASSILTGMLKALPRTGGVAIQAEDEIASIGMCLGAAAAGKRALTATSGPGMSLYSENLGMAQMMELPLVVVNVQRQGPATGSATKGAEGDVQFARWGTSGGLPLVALAPTTVEECFTLTVRAFEIAEQLRTPAILLTSKELAQTRERVDLEALGGDTGGMRLPVPPGEVPALHPIGGPTLARFTTSSHDERGHITGDPAIIDRLVRRLAAKIEHAAPELEIVREDLRAGAATLVVSYGVTARAAREAVAAARDAGLAVSHLILHTLWPVPERAIREALGGFEPGADGTPAPRVGPASRSAPVRRVVVPENNLGQYAREIERLAAGCGVDVVPVNRMDTGLVTPGEILDAIRSVHPSPPRIG